MAIWPLYSLGSSSMWLNPLALLVTAMVATMRSSSTIEVVEVIWMRGKLDSLRYTHEPSSTVADDQ